MPSPSTLSIITSWLGVADDADDGSDGSVLMGFSLFDGEVCVSALLGVMLLLSLLLGLDPGSCEAC